MDTSSPIGKFYFILIAAIAEMEVSMIRERTLLGLKAAKKKRPIWWKAKDICRKK
ncbi:recombinase family protein [Listeria rocourtiae]|uniref:recombinase family protein n=1 Tax=Listeria rocourtiae TaxID=647910 RepID=UPI003CC5B55F